MGREAPTGAREFSSSRGAGVHKARLAREAQHPVPYPWLFAGTEPGERSPNLAVRPLSPRSGDVRALRRCNPHRDFCVAA